uniref:Uncharacterized protein n=1 Tax=Dulem virus 39 TaxID=3145757 RepID=A0AAU8B8C1_9CAUD
MRTLAKNKQKMYYALQSGEVPIYETDEDGNIKYITIDGEQVPVETGEYELGYSEPVKFFGNIALSGGDSEVVEYGIDTSAYDATLVTDKGAVPITETSLIWFQSEVGYKDNAKTIVDGNTADYRVLAVKPSLNEAKYILGKLTK